ncbi:malto-oligosyltrehalose synthase [Longimicrobium sp.]|uniref:malto-oligosyltrehalose synthase n=1 Tax=Longimicrobium sp. TaxID=2029185 RepID=UPI002E321955|nr:malto-oligosyltrehalose synthase [Longimicrobium sp.]HEX6041348.1 malto-oligosyltrehalose synthase [Longimicrobium sp.]
MNPTEQSSAAPGTRVPTATYRIQFNAGFTFRQATEIVPYLADLGVSDLYASPYLQARPGSLHGYDIVNHASLNPEIGTEHDHARMSAALREHGLGHLLDIVPNHMGIAGGANAWWMDVLENGWSSPYASFFDVDWQPRKPELAGKVLLPVLGDQYGQVLERGELRLAFEDGAFRLNYFENWFPVAPASTGVVLRLALEQLDGVLETEHPDRMELESVATALQRLPARRHDDPANVAEHRREKVVTQRRLSALYQQSAPVRDALDAALVIYNGTAGDPRSFDRLDALLGEQSYRLAFWRVAAEEINYRRFFDVNDLAGVRVEQASVFQETHRLILRLVREGKVTGLRIDHPDGLFHPREYLRDLQRETVGIPPAEPFYILVEKILTGTEPLPEDWPVAGTVGYEFLNEVNGLFVDPRNEERMDAIYRAFTGARMEFTDLVYEKKRLILRSSLISELTVLTTMLDRISERNRCSRDFTWGALRDALREVVACFPVYRTYVDAFAGQVHDRDRQYVDLAVRRAKRRNPGTSASIFDFVRNTLLLHWPEALDEEARRQHAGFVMKFQQLTGPVMAKGVEDTAFYVFNRLVSLNEVGGEPDRFGRTPEEFHLAMLDRAQRWPHALSSSSTHDTKRSEDVRARINVLSEIPELWAQRVEAWAGFNARHKQKSEDGHAIPDPNDEYLLYQTLVGAWPFDEVDDQARQDLVSRLQAYMEKATREAKTHTSWINPDAAYDEGLAAFVAAILEPDNDAFLDDFLPFQRMVSRVGMVNALAQTLLKLTAPGVPDVYQGQETWDFSLVDPDNRRPVDYDQRRALLDSLASRAEEVDGAALARELVEGWQDGRIKLHLHQRALRLRAALPDVFGAGAYVPLTPEGERAEHVVAFARTAEGAAAITVVPRLPGTMTRDRDFALPEARDWHGTRVPLPDELAGRYRNVLTGEELRVGDKGLDVSVLFAAFPVALLERID